MIWIQSAWSSTDITEKKIEKATTKKTDLEKQSAGKLPRWQKESMNLN